MELLISLSGAMQQESQEAITTFGERCITTSFITERTSYSTTI
jgi:hypothetical protein